MTELTDCSSEYLSKHIKNDDTILVLTHFQFGDLYFQLPLFEHLRRFFKFVYVPVKTDVFKSFDIVKNTNIIFLPGKYIYSYKATIDDIDVTKFNYYILLGDNNKQPIDNIDSNEYIFGLFYYPVKLNSMIYNKIPNFIEQGKRKLPDFLKCKKYFFISLKGSDGFRNIQIPINISDNILCICPDKNLYPIGHKFYSDAQQCVGLTTCHYIPIIENSKMIVVLDSGFFMLTLLCNLSHVSLLICVMKSIYWNEPILISYVSYTRTNKYLFIEDTKFSF
jgi:hypothetical protein